MITFAVSNLVIMELLKNYIKEGFSFEILGEEIDNPGRKYSRLFITLRLTNTSNKKKKINFDAKYLSSKTGMHILDQVLPPIRARNGDCFMPANSFVDEKLFFYDLKDVNNGDRIEFEVFNIVSLLLVREQGQWYIADKSERSTSHEIKKRIEHFEMIEENFGISLQNFSVKIINAYTIKLFCEVVAIDKEISKHSFNIEVAVYDTENNILGLSIIRKYDGDFEGFEVFSFNEISLNIPVEEIGKIRFYPTR